MNLDIRKAVLSNLSNATNEDVRSTITDAMTITEEKVLPGLGVLFEVYWRNATEEDRNKIVTTIARNIQQ